VSVGSVEEVLQKLKAVAKPDRLDGMARYGMVVDRRLGVSVPDLRKIAKAVGKNHHLALELWRTGIPEARIVAAMIDEPAKVTEQQMEDWVKDLNSWDVCDQVCMNLFEKTPLVWTKIGEWSEREEEFVKRAAFTAIACLAWHDRKTDDAEFLQLLSTIARGATDERNYVWKAVNWALRNIGKRNRTLNRAAIEAAREILSMEAKAARWIALSAIRELESVAVQRRLRRAEQPSQEEDSSEPT
jgi:3-methyladenine DNA glycosylase AlkD